MTVQHLPTDVELEVKLAVPSAKWERLTQFLIDKGGVRRTRLQAAYIDTPDFRLSKAGIALRLRKEGRYWVQTLKVQSAQSLERLEHNVRVVHAGPGTPSFDPHLHQQHPAGQIFSQCLAPDRYAELAIRFQTNIYRRTALVNARGGVLEYALDDGEVFAVDAEGVKQTRKVQELEIELKSGRPDLVFSHAKMMIRRFGAYFQTKSKAQHGAELARKIDVTPATRAATVSLGQQTNRDIAKAILASCLMQILPNAAEMAADVSEYDDHVHQFRVGLRRLRTGLKILGLQHIYLSEFNTAILADVFGQLGHYRDANFLSEKLSPTLEKVNAPPMVLVKHADFQHPGAIIRHVNVQLLLADLMLMLTQFNEQLGDDKSLAKKFKTLLDDLYKSTRKTASKYLEIGDEARHDLRKKLKRLRYSLEFAKDFCKASDYKKYLKELSNVAEELGQYNDVCVALEKVNVLVNEDKNILFAQGWLVAEKSRLVTTGYKALNSFYRLKKVW